MPNTKIINVLRNDSFDEVFNEFVNCDAQEVIFIFPKGSRFIKSEAYFETIRSEADSMGKVVSVMTADPIVASFANKYELNVLENAGRKARAKTTSPDQIDTPVTRLVHQTFTTNDTEETDEEPLARPVRRYATAMPAPLEEDETEEKLDDEDKEEDSQDESLEAITEEEDDQEDINADENSEEADEDTEDQITGQNQHIDPEDSVLSSAHEAQNFEESSNGDIELASADYDEELPNGAFASLAMAARKTVSSTTKRAPAHPQLKPSTRPKSMGDVVVERPRPTIKRYATTSQDIPSEDEEAFMDSPKRLKDARRASVSEDISKIWLSQEDISKRRPATKTQAVSARGSKGSFSSKLPFIFISIAVIIATLTFYTILGKAKVTIKPLAQTINFDLKVAASSNTAAIDTDLNNIPGQKFSSSQEVSEIFPATGQKDVAQKASGTITIYNKGTASQRLVATTRFASPEGLIFRVNASVNVPGATKSGGSTTPGSVTATVVADRPGPEYNLKATSFTIPGFSGTPKFDDFSATSTNAMTGGFNGPSKIITEDDYSKALESLTAKLKAQVVATLSQQAKDLKVMNTITVTINDPKTNAKTGEAADNLEMTLDGSASTIAFREQDIKELIKSYITAQSKLSLIDAGLKIDYQDPVLSADKGTVNFTTKVEAQGVPAIDTVKIAKDILGMPLNSLQDYIKSNKAIESAKIMLSPFWLRSVPSDPSKVQVNVEI